MLNCRHQQTPIRRRRPPGSSAQAARPCWETSRAARPVGVLSLCSGMAGDAAAFELAGIPHELKGVAEIDPIACAVLEHKFPATPNLGDLNTCDWSSYHGQVDILTAGFPCQPHSAAGRRKGLNDPRECSAGVLHAVASVQPEWVLLENVPGFASSNGGRALRRLLARLRALGYRCEVRIIDAADVLPQRRRRLWILGHRGGAKPAPAEVFAVAAGGRGRVASRKAVRVQDAARSADRPDLHHPPRLGTLTASGSGVIKAGMRLSELDFLVVQNIKGYGRIVRRPTSLEIMRAQGFPDDWLNGVTWRGKELSRAQIAKLVGNAWPVPVAALIVAAIGKLKGWAPA